MSSAVWLPAAAAAAAAVAIASAVLLALSLAGTRERLSAAHLRLEELQEERSALQERHRRELAEMEARGARAAVEPKEEARAADVPVLVAALLTPGVLRSLESRTAEVRLAPSVLLVELQLDLAEDLFADYQASLHTASGEEVYRAGELRAERTDSRILLRLQVPSWHLFEGDYSVRLWGTNNHELEEIESYSVRVRR